MVLVLPRASFRKVVTNFRGGLFLYPAVQECFKVFPPVGWLEVFMVVLFEVPPLEFNWVLIPVVRDLAFTLVLQALAESLPALQLEFVVSHCSSIENKYTTT